MKFTKERTERIINLIKAGNYKETAAKSCGISEATLYLWIAKGEKGRSKKYIEFYESLKKAESEAEARNVMIIQRASETNWQAAAWWLERTNFKKWGRKEKVEVGGDNDGAPIVIRVSDKMIPKFINTNKKDG